MMKKARDRISLGFADDVCLADNHTPMEALAEIGSTDVAINEAGVVRQAG